MSIGLCQRPTTERPVFAEFVSFPVFLGRLLRFAVYNVCMPDIVVRAAEAEDAEALVQLINLAFRAERPFVEGNRLDLAEVRAHMAKGPFLVLVEGETIVGCVHAEAHRDRGHIGLLSVEPGRQKTGVGKQLMTAAEEHLRNGGCKSADLRFINHRAELLRFYSQLGYIESGTAAFPHTSRMKMPFHFVEMTKTLA
jgi:GNAT superfamily N-acetyltransferase